MPNGYSVIITPPLFTISSCRILLHLGWVIFKPEATTAIVLPSACRHPLWAAVSQPNASPLTMTYPIDAYLYANWYAAFNPLSSALREPIMAIRLFSENMSGYMN